MAFDPLNLILHVSSSEGNLVVVSPTAFSPNISTTSSAATTIVVTPNQVSPFTINTGIQSYAVSSSHALIADTALTVLGSIQSASVAVSSSYAATSSIALNVPVTASYATSASYAPQLPVVSSSYATSASWAPVQISSSYATTASYAPSPASASYALSASVAQFAVNSATASLAISATSASYAPVPISASYSDTASYAANAGNSTPASASYSLTSSYSQVAQSVLNTPASSSYATSASYAATAPWSGTLGTPNTIAGYGITDFNSRGDARWAALGIVAVAQDSVTRADSTTSPGTATELGGAWTALAGTWGVSSSRLYSATGVDGDLVQLGNAANGEVQSDFTSQYSIHAPELFFRAVDSTHYYLAELFSGSINLYIRNPAFTKLTSSLFSPADNSIVTLKTTFNGPVVNIYANGVQMISYLLTGSNTALSGTLCGLRNGTATSANFFDNYVVNTYTGTSSSYATTAGGGNGIFTGSFSGSFSGSVYADKAFISGGLAVGIQQIEVSSMAQFHKGWAAPTMFFVSNDSPLANAQASVRAGLVATNSSASYVAMGVLGGGFGTVGALHSGSTYLEGFSTNLVISNISPTEPVQIATGPSRVERLRIDVVGNIIATGTSIFSGSGANLTNIPVQATASYSVTSSYSTQNVFNDSLALNGPFGQTAAGVTTAQQTTLDIYGKGNGSFGGISGIRFFPSGSPFTGSTLGNWNIFGLADNFIPSQAYRRGNFEFYNVLRLAPAFTIDSSSRMGINAGYNQPFLAELTVFGATPSQPVVIFSASSGQTADVLQTRDQNNVARARIDSAFNFVGNLVGSASIAPVSSSYATTASYATIAQNVLGSIVSASYATTASYFNNAIGSVTSASYAQTASILLGSVQTASYALSVAKDNLTTISSDYTASGADVNIICNAAAASIKVYLPDAAIYIKNQYKIKLVKSNVNTVTVFASGSQLIDDSSTITLNQRNETLGFVSDGLTWWVF